METTNKNISRRNFIRLSGISGAALTIGFSLPAFGKDTLEEILSMESAEESGIELNAWVSIDTSGKVTLMSHRAEMGQGAYQAIPQMIAEELEVNLDQVTILFAPGDGRKYGSQITGGSSTVRSAYKRLMRMGASAREMLIEAAAKKGNVNTTECYAENGTVIHRPSGKKFGYGDLVEAASKLQPPKEVKLKDPKDYKIIRKPLSGKTWLSKPMAPLCLEWIKNFRECYMPWWSAIRAFWER
jgi:isoquinoline 1-oxidoreductase beta subunit